MIALQFVLRIIPNLLFKKTLISILSLNFPLVSLSVLCKTPNNTPTNSSSNQRQHSKQRSKKGEMGSRSSTRSELTSNNRRKIAKGLSQNPRATVTGPVPETDPLALLFRLRLYLWHPGSDSGDLGTVTIVTTRASH